MSLDEDDTLAGGSPSPREANGSGEGLAIK